MVRGTKLPRIEYFQLRSRTVSVWSPYPRGFPHPAQTTYENSGLRIASGLLRSNDGVAAAVQVPALCDQVAQGTSNVRAFMRASRGSQERTHEPAASDALTTRWSKPTLLPTATHSPPVRTLKVASR